MSGPATLVASISKAGTGAKVTYTARKAGNYKVCYLNASVTPTLHSPTDAPRHRGLDDWEMQDRQGYLARWYGWSAVLAATLLWFSGAFRTASSQGLCQEIRIHRHTHPSSHTPSLKRHGWVVGRQVSVTYFTDPVPGSPFAVGILHGKIDGERSWVPPQPSRIFPGLASASPASPAPPCNPCHCPKS